MGMIFGRKNCNYNRDWKIVLWLDSDNVCEIAEQLRKEEADKIYQEIKLKLQDKSDFIEFQTEESAKTNTWEYFSKKHIVSVKMKRDL